MKTLDYFKKEKPESWRIFGPANKITAVLYFHSTKKRLSKEQIREKLKESIADGEFESGLALLIKYNEARAVRQGAELGYSLTKKTRETFRNLYQLN